MPFSIQERREEVSVQWGLSCILFFIIASTIMNALQEVISLLGELHIIVQPQEGGNGLDSNLHRMATL